MNRLSVFSEASSQTFYSACLPKFGTEFQAGYKSVVLSQLAYLVGDDNLCQDKELISNYVTTATATTLSTRTEQAKGRSPIEVSLTVNVPDLCHHHRKCREYSTNVNTAKDNFDFPGK